MLRIRDVYPGSQILNLSILDLGSRIQKEQQKKGVRKFFFTYRIFFVATIKTKLKIILFLNWLRKNLGQFTKNYRTFYPKNCYQLLKNIVLGSGIWKKPISDPGSKMQRIPIRITAPLIIFPASKVHKLNSFSNLAPELSNRTHLRPEILVELFSDIMFPLVQTSSQAEMKRKMGQLLYLTNLKRSDYGKKVKVV